MLARVDLASAILSTLLKKKVSIASDGPGLGDSSLKITLKRGGAG